MDEFAWPQTLVLVGKRGLEPDRARGLVDLVVDQKQLALTELVSVVLVKRRDLYLTLCHGVLHRRQIALRQGENHYGRTEGGQHGDRRLIAGVDDVAGIDQTEADAAVDRRGNGRVA